MKHWIYGKHAAAAALLNPERHIYQVCVQKHLLAELQDLKLSPQVVDQKFFANKFGTQAVHQGIALEVEALPALTIEDVMEEGQGASLILALDQVTDPHNVGAILRSAAAFEAKAVLVTEYKAADLLSPALYKAASGAAEKIPLIPVVNLSQALGLLKKAEYWVLGLAEGGEQDLTQTDLAGKWVVTLGAEGTGLRRLVKESCDILSHLPTGTDFSTLNVSNAAAIAAYEFYRQNKAS